MYEDAPGHFDRRHGPDVWEKMLTLLAVLGWVLLIGAVVAYDIAKPNSMMKQFWPLAPKMDMIWDNAFYSMALYILVADFVVSVIGLLINGRRHKRKHDQYSLSLMLMTLLSAVGIAFIALGWAR